MGTALAIFVKTPGLSPVKTRLAAGIGAAAAVRFHELAADAVAAVARAAAARVPELAPMWAVAERAALADARWTRFPRLWQGEGGLGERIAQVEHQIAARHARWLLIGADTPQLTVEDLEQAASALAQAPYAIGHSADGGFWLYGAREPLPAAQWRSLPWSQADTGTQLLALMQGRGAVRSLRTLRDVDDAGDLAPLRQALDALLAPLPEQVALRRWLRTLC